MAQSLPQPLNFNKSTFFIVTGASRGIGATIAIECARKLSNNSRVLLTARDADKLEGTKQKINAINPKLHVITHVIDLTAPSNDALKNLLTSALPIEGVSAFEQSVIVHNVGSTGDVTKRARECSKLSEWQENFNTNVFSVVILNNIFLEVFQSVRKYVINITSKAGIEPFEGFAFYCPNKAAREMYFRVLAAEESEDKSLTILNYAPGPVDTDMLQNAGKNSISVGMREFVKAGLKNGSVLTTTQTTEKMIAVLEKGDYVNGAHIDYFDV